MITPNSSIRVTVTAGPDRGLRRSLVEQELLLIGRGDQCGLALTDPSVSRVHCRLLLSGGRITLEDVGSRWGVVVNGVRVQESHLRIADQLRIGDSELRLEATSNHGEPAAQLTQCMAKARTVRASETCVPVRIPEMGYASPSLTGAQFLRFRVGNVLGQSRTGTTYRAFDPLSDRVVALTIYSQFSSGDETSQRKFIRSVRRMIALNHPNLVRLITAGRRGRTCFAVSEFVDSESVSDLVRRNGIAGMLDWRTAWQIASGVAKGLEFAHSRQIIHQNLSPEHILVDKTSGGVRLSELMLAKALDDSQFRLSQSVGDLCYLAPEQLSGQPIDARTDLYSLGAVLYTLLTGRPPFVGPTADLLPRILFERPVRPTRYHLSIPAGIEAVILRLLSKNPEDRYHSTAALLDIIREIDSHSS